MRIKRSELRHFGRDNWRWSSRGCVVGKRTAKGEYICSKRIRKPLYRVTDLRGCKIEENAKSAAKHGRPTCSLRELVRQPHSRRNIPEPRVKNWRPCRR